MKPRFAITAALAASSLALAGCYVVPVIDQKGEVQYYHYPVPPAGTPVAAYPGTHPAAPGPVTLHARLYPENALAQQTGMVAGTVTNMRTGKGRFTLNYQGETLVGEATRSGADERDGVASAYGSGGSYMQCEYRMNSPMQGSGNCTFSNGARYRVHIGT